MAKSRIGASWEERKKEIKKLESAGKKERRRVELSKEQE